MVERHFSVYQSPTTIITAGYEKNLNKVKKNVNIKQINTYFVTIMLNK
jgi:hypothetical protein